MKKVLMIFTVLLHGALSAQESPQDNNNFQIDKGIWSIEGDVSFNYGKSENLQNYVGESTGYGFAISPKVGYTISNNLILGLGVGYDHREYKSQREDPSENSTNTTKQYGIFPYIKKHFPLSKKLALHIQGEARYSKYKPSTEHVSTEVSYSTESHDIFIGLRPGISYSLSKNFLMQANIGALGYNSTKSKRDGEDNTKSNSFAFSLKSSNLYFGIVWLI
ncbi:outer membrane protein [Mangrovimonas sp. DI 80]|uniref:outer membrane protein n=1 Tax=Mangrovimonas sp. DI 80 TaxID=1779330 RepID=UPI000F4D5E5A|nr:outer membrane beta-barrel protein [Mangrovimonas sp. DI 80]